MKIFSYLLIKTIKVYQLIISPYLGNNCRYLPTCSEYFIDCLNEYGFIYLSNTLIPKYSRKFANILWVKSDIKVIDNFFINGTAKIIFLISSTVRVIQSGYLYHYAFTMILGLILFLFLFYDF